MYKVILVDDEFWICQGLRAIVDWGAMDMEIVASTDNALTALELCKQETPDIIITDINMPVLNGLEMIERLNELCPEAVMIIISGHDEFSYARRAVSLHVFDYLLKPIDLKDLTNVLERAQKELARRRESLRAYPGAEKMAESDKEALTGWIVDRLLCRLLRKGQLTPMQARAVQDIENVFNCVFLVEVDHHGEQPNALLMSDDERLIGELEAAMRQYAPMTLLPRNGGAYFTSFYICLFQEDKRALQDMVERCAERLKSLMERFGQTFTIARGEIQSSLYEIASSAKQADAACQKKFLYGKNQVFSCQASGPERKMDAVKALENIQYTEIAEDVIFNASADFDTLFEDIRQFVFAAGEDAYTCLHGIIQNLEIQLLEELNKLPFGAEFQFNPFSITHQILQSGPLDAILRSLQTQLEDLAAGIAARQKNETNVYINKAIHYLNSHYRESDLNLKTVAKVANMSISYFCSKFKLATGDSCISYLTDIRMKKAKELLTDTDMRVHEIASYVGYENPTYFCTAFKRSAGCTPESFRKQGKE